MKQFALGNFLKCFFISLQRIIPATPRNKPNTDMFSKLNTLIVENIIKEFSGLSSQEYIRSKTLLEAKRLLTYTTISVKERSHNLEFEDSAYFSRFFKQSPKLFRDTTSKLL